LLLILCSPLFHSTKTKIINILNNCKLVLFITAFYPTPNSKEAEKDDEKTMESAQNATESLTFLNKAVDYVLLLWKASHISQIFGTDGGYIYIYIYIYIYNSILTKYFLA